MRTHPEGGPTPIYTTTSVGSIGLEMGIAVLLGILFGLWLDRHLGTDPWGVLAFTGFGIAAGFKGLFRAAREAKRATDSGADDSET